MKKLFLSLFTLGILSNVGCGSTDTIKQDKVAKSETYQSYAVQYDENSHQLSSDAQFRVSGPSGTTIELQSPSAVSLNGEVLGETRNDYLTGTFYKLNKTAAFSELQTFKWIDGDGKSYVNSISFRKAELDKFDLGKVKLAYVFEVVFTGEDISGNDSVTITLDQPGSSGSTLTATAYAPNHSVIFNASDILSKMLPDVYTRIRISRKVSIPLSQGTEKGGSVTATFVGLTGSVEFQK